VRRAAEALLVVALVCAWPLGCRSHAVPSTSSVSEAGALSESIPMPGAPCGSFDAGLECRQFDSLPEAFASTLVGGPRVVAIGEAHAQRGTAVPSSATHFTGEVLPLLAGRASDLVVELLNPPKGCAPTTAAVREQQAVVTTQQAPTDQGEYVAMGARARQLGIVPDLLRPTCADLDAVKAAGDDGVAASLEMIARLTQEQVDKLVDRDARTPGDEGKLVVTYGGALHNDLSPSAAKAPWAFGPQVSAHVDGRYVEVDLYVPELIDDSPAWRSLPFYSHYDPARLGAKTTVFRQGKSFVIVLPRTVTKG
jgi:hypothetical protein